MAPNVEIKLAIARELLQYVASAGSIEKRMERIQRACRCAGGAYRELEQWKDRQKE